MANTQETLNARPPLRLVGRLAEFSLPLFILALALITGYIEPRFFSISNIENLARQLVPLTIVAVGQALAIIGGGLDLSIAAVMSLSGVAGVLVMNEYGIAPGIVTMICTGALAGLANGVIIAWFRASPLIVTLSMMSIAQAVALILSNGVPIYRVPEAFVEAVGFRSILGVPSSVLIGVCVLILGAVILNWTRFGRYVYAIGSSSNAAARSGVNVRLTTTLIYVVVGATSGIAAIVLTAWVGAAQPVGAPNLTLESIAAVVLGGVALAGGSGGIFHIILGTVIIGTLSNALNMIGISAYYQTLAVGLVIVMAVMLDRFRK